jgi:hypothetical protein
MMVGHAHNFEKVFSIFGWPVKCAPS